MTSYLRNLFVYFEYVLHPAGGSFDNGGEKRKRKPRRPGTLQSSPESLNLRGNQKKQDKLRRNPAP
ncbi:MAG TPA: hypothetical protein VFR58_11650 [Flavisolibacter sp.]|nr:hypothetical protein [Flavisolibacter sp.]